jgi:ABC-type bacteriocin/lantibiotic exporter with double-glycine peptidase domain
MKLQIVIKVVNDSVGPDNIIPILLVFGAYLRITNNSLLLPITIKRAKTIRKTSNKIKKFYTKRYINNVLRIRNSPDITEILQLPI